VQLHRVRVWNGTRRGLLVVDRAHDPHEPVLLSTGPRAQLTFASLTGCQLGTNAVLLPMVWKRSPLCERVGSWQSIVTSAIHRGRPCVTLWRMSSVWSCCELSRSA
jgi:hypothetical protein